MKIAGRCPCGVLASIAAQVREREAHLQCNGLRRCRVCREVKPLATGFRTQRRVCRACQAERHTAYIRRRMAEDEAFRERHREACRLWSKTARIKNTGYAERERQRNRHRYHTDPAYAEKKRADYRRRYWARKVA